MFLHNFSKYLWHFGTRDTLTVIANMKFVLLPNERIKFKSVWIIFYATGFL